MKKILITGKNGYIANSLKIWFEKNMEFSVELLDLKDKNWKTRSFKDVDTIIHTAALVHKNEAQYTIEDYRRINTELTVELAQKAKAEKVLQLIFISTMAVYGTKMSCFKQIEIDDQTPLLPNTKYGITKFEAEEELKKLEEEQFIVSIIRPPFVYGRNCPGNYQTLKQLTLKVGIIPKIKNKKSIIYIDNLCECLLQICKGKLGGIFTPQNSALQSTYKISELIAKYNGKKVLCTALITPFVCLASTAVKPIKKAFGNEYYSKKLSEIENVNYNVVNFEDSVKFTEE